MRNRFAAINTNVVVFTMILVVLACLAAVYLPLAEFEKKTVPELDRKAKILSQSVNSLIVEATDQGVPFDSLRGMEEFFCLHIKGNPEVRYLAVTDLQGKVLYHSVLDTRENKCSQGIPLNAKVRALFREKSAQSEPLFITRGGYYNNSASIVNNRARLGILWTGVDQKFVRVKMKNILYNVLTVILVSFLMAFELVIFFVTYAISGPILSIRKLMTQVAGGDFSRYLETRVHGEDEIGRLVEALNLNLRRVNEHYIRLRERLERLPRDIGKQAAELAAWKRVENHYKFGSLEQPRTFSINLLIYIRPALFLLIFSESLSLSFFPLFVQKFYEPISGISRELVIGLPISIFMLFWALSLPSVGGWSDRIGRRKPLLLGAIITAAGLLLTGMSVSMYDLLIWRSLTAIGYGMVFITCQGYIIDNTSPQHRGKGMAMFLSGFFSGSLCGASIGGILAEYIGYENVFYLSSGMSLSAMAFVYYFVNDKPTLARKGAQKLRLSDFKLLLTNKYFLMITFLTAVPAKICLVGLLYYAGPLFLKELDIDQSSIGRVLMTYGIAIIIISPLAARFSDLARDRKFFVIVGSLLAGLGMLLVFWQPNLFGMLASVALLGLGHAVGVSSQLTLVTEFCKEEGERIGVGTVMGIFRLLERLGNISGPLLMGGLIYLLGASGERNPLEVISMAIGGVGLLVILGVVLFALLTGLFFRSKKTERPLEEISG